MADDYHPDDKRNIMVNELRIIEYIDPDGALNTVDLSQATGGAELEEQAYMNLVAWALAFSLAPKVAAILGVVDGDG